LQFIVLLENAVGNAVLSVPYGMLEKLKFELYSFFNKELLLCSCKLRLKNIKKP
jgi:hypothetical protein